MEANGKVIFKQAFENRKRQLDREKQFAEIKNYIPEKYNSEIRSFQQHCRKTEQEENLASYIDFLHLSILVERVKKSTWEKRVVAIRKYLAVTRKVTFDETCKEQLSFMRKMFQTDENADLIKLEGKSNVNKDHLVESLHLLSARPKAICLVNLYSGNRPNEMVRLKIKDFDLEGFTLSVYLKKQKKWHYKRLNLETVKAVREYIHLYKLKQEDYFVGRTHKSGKYKSEQISETAYRNQLKKWTGLSPYNFRKTLVAHMHSKGADLSTIAKQTGHASTQVLEKHYLTVSDTSVDKYL
ncbi:site-specific integrase [Planococcus sp. NCCP-2050]|uniref:tyrosine-type recombinase/integrase n=1 Tax=Planococcus sp. NCCP-2050 TaxID=2944679 RepID=UPI00203FA7FE|nr:site-specific integrase [Planococcus sp. NCCP-2050]GKW46917.1 hypothetical protein NCCP2050_26090 [Planococcus sp. NCCP-2050]